MKRLFLPTVAGLVLGAAPSIARELSNIEKCQLEITNSSRVESSLARYKKDCGNYPAKLIYLIDKPKKCVTRDKDRTPYLESNEENRRLTSEYSYRLMGKTYELKSMDCPN